MTTKRATDLAADDRVRGLGRITGTRRLMRRDAIQIAWAHGTIEVPGMLYVEIEP